MLTRIRNRAVAPWRPGNEIARRPGIIERALRDEEDRLALEPHGENRKKLASARDAVPSDNVRPGALAIDDYSNCDTGTKRKTSLRHESEDRYERNWDCQHDQEPYDDQLPTMMPRLISRDTNCGKNDGDSHCVLEWP